MVSAEGRAALALLYTAVSLTALEYVFLPGRVEARLRSLPGSVLAEPSLRSGLIWAGGTVLLNLVLPLLIVLFVHCDRPASIGYSWGGIVRHLWVYVGLYLLMLPVIFLAAERPEFRATYPFVKAATGHWTAFLIWEAAYLAQFFALESFFRGYLLFTLERRVGQLSIFAMAVPYCMIHFHKPFAEANGAIVAGIVLGTLALRYRSFYGGALLHGLVALTMDSLAAHRAGLFR